MKVSVEFAKQQLDRARQIISRRVILGPSHIGELVTLVIQGNGNMLSTRPAMIYNVKACTQERALEARELLKTSVFMASIEDADEQGVQDRVNEILNNAQLSFTVPLSSTNTFSNGETVNALVEEYTTKITDENPVAEKRIGLNNVTAKKAVAVSRSTVFSNWDDDDDATMEDNTDAPQGAAGQDDPFADKNVPASGVAETTPAV